VAFFFLFFSKTIHQLFTFYAPSSVSQSLVCAYFTSLRFVLYAFGAAFFTSAPAAQASPKAQM
jgi:hypothetical protein